MISYPEDGMDLLEESVVPEHARAVKREAREFAVEHIEPNAEEYFARGEYPWDILEAGQEAGLVAQNLIVIKTILCRSSTSRCLVR